MPEDLPENPPRSAAELWREFRAAVAYLTRGAATRADAVDIARGGAFFPVLGLALGGLAASIATAVGGSVGAGGVAALAVLSMTALSAASLPRGLAGAVAGALSPARDAHPGVPARAAGILAALATTGLKGWALSVTPGAAVGFALCLAVMLGRWAFVVQAYGSQSARQEGLGAVFPRAMQFREFALASVSAMALTLVLANAIGLVLILWTATQTILVRIFVHRRAGGVDERSLAAGAELAETSTLLLCAGLARAILAG